MERIRKFFRRFGKGLKARGYTLLEVSAVIAVTGTLMAVAMPVVGDKIADSKVAAATQAVQAIRDSIVNFTKDTGVPPFYSTTTVASSLALPGDSGVDDSAYFRVLVTADGQPPSVTGSTGITAGTGWPGLNTDNPADARSIEGQLNSNVPKYPTTGVSAWKGPYLPGTHKDPWGNKYIVTIKWIAQPNTGSGSVSYQRAAFVISAGPNGVIETDFDQPIKYINAAVSAQPSTPLQFKPGGDDIISRLQ